MGPPGDFGGGGGFPSKPCVQNMCLIFIFKNHQGLQSGTSTGMI